MSGLGFTALTSSDPQARNRPFDVQPRANGAMAAAMQWTTVLAFVLGLAGVLSPDPVGTVAGWFAVATVAAAPLGRVVWLSIRWVQRRDYRFAATAASLIVVVGMGAALALAQSG